MQKKWCQNAFSITDKRKVMYMKCIECKFIINTEPGDLYCDAKKCELPVNKVSDEHECELGKKKCEFCGGSGYLKEPPGVNIDYPRRCPKCNLLKPVTEFYAKINRPPSQKPFAKPIKTVKVCEYFCECPYQKGTTKDLMNSEINQSVCTYTSGNCVVSKILPLIKDLVAEYPTHDPAYLLDKCDCSLCTIIRKLDDLTKGAPDG